MFSRRKFLLDCAQAAVIATVSPLPATVAPAIPHGVALGQIPFNAFKSQVGKVFNVSQLSSTVALRLISAQQTPARSHPRYPALDAQHERFSLLFQGPASQALAQDTHTFQTDGLGRFSMFIAPVGHRDSSACFYEAIFNRPFPSTTQEVIHG